MAPDDDEFVKEETRLSGSWFEQHRDRMYIFKHQNGTEWCFLSRQNQLWPINTVDSKKSIEIQIAHEPAWYSFVYICIHFW